MAQIGEAFIKLSVRGTGELRAALSKARTQLNRFGSSADKTLSKFADRIEGSTEGVRKFQGAIGGVIGVFGFVVAAAFALGKAIGNLITVFESGESRARAFRESLDVAADATTAATNLELVREKTDELNATLANASAGGLKGAMAQLEILAKGGRSRVEAERDALNRLAAEQAAVIGRQREIERREAAQAEREAAMRGKGAAELALLRVRIAGEENDERRAALEIEAENIELQERLLDLFDRRQEAALAENQDAINAINDEKAALIEASNLRIQLVKKGVEAAKKAAEEKAEKEIAEARRVRDATIEANREAAQATVEFFNDAARQLSGADGGFSQIADLIADVRREVEIVSRRLD